jgi:hypothetical protein
MILIRKIYKDIVKLARYLNHQELIIVGLINAFEFNLQVNADAVFKCLITIVKFSTIV